MLGDFTDNQTSTHKERFQGEHTRDENRGRSLARSSVLSSIQSMISGAGAMTGDNAELHDSYVKGLEDALMLIEQSEPLHVWECDVRKDRKQWGDLSPRKTVAHLDGVEVKHCVAADSKAGAVLIVKLDPNGRPTVDSEGIVVELRHGNVDLVSKGG